MSELYRPTVRMDAAFRQYIDSAFHASRLDRNQIIRLMLFCAPHSAIYADKLREYLKGDAPAPCWNLRESTLFLDQQAGQREVIGASVIATIGEGVTMG